MSVLDDFERFVPHRTLDPLSGRGMWVARQEAQGVALICGSEEQAKEVAEFLNARNIAPLVETDPDEVEDADEEEAIEEMEDDDEDEEFGDDYEDIPDEEDRWPVLGGSD